MQIRARDNAEQPADVRDYFEHGYPSADITCQHEFGPAALICHRIPFHDGPHYDAVEFIEWSEDIGPWAH